MGKRSKIVWIVLLLVFSAGLFLLVRFYANITNPAQLFVNEPTPTLAPTATPNITSTPAPTQSALHTEVPEITPTPTPAPMSEDELTQLADLSFMKDRVNIMVLGIDESDERTGSFRTDTMILVTVDFKSMDVHMISIPRDSFVRIYNKDNLLLDEEWPYNKINAAFSLGGGINKGGFASTLNTVSNLLGGMPVDYYVGFNMNVVKAVVNAMGGVDYDVDVEVSMNGRELHPGYQHLDGQAVLDYCRQRKGSSDHARVDRQQRMLMAIFSQLKSSGQIANIPRIYQAVMDNIHTNLSFEQISALALHAVRMGEDQLKRVIVPGEAKRIYERDCWAIHNEDFAKALSKIYGVEIPLDPAADVNNIDLAMQEHHELLLPELAAAHRALDEADFMLSEYKEYLSKDMIKRIDSAVKELTVGYLREIRTKLEIYTPLLNTCLTEAQLEIYTQSIAYAYVYDGIYELQMPPDADEEEDDEEYSPPEVDSGNDATGGWSSVEP